MTSERRRVLEANDFNGITADFWWEVNENDFNGIISLQSAMEIGGLPQSRRQSVEKNRTKTSEVFHAQKNIL